ncbi:helix-turn-helix domain-containing protein [Streptomyces sp. BP-8]|uniref:Helix-turn-helix domain-containing protein n=1 Tax=Streptomyces sirii TaxID=3127701 RepID=A0ABZ2QEW2_9ACTN
MSAASPRTRRPGSRCGRRRGTGSGRPDAGAARLGGCLGRRASGRAGAMRYAQGGGLGPHEQAERERIRMLAAEGFDRGEKNTAIAKGLRVSVRSVERWRRSWRDNGIAGLRCSGPANAAKVGPQEFAMLEEELLRGAVFHGWPD